MIWLNKVADCDPLPGLCHNSPLCMTRNMQRASAISMERQSGRVLRSRVTDAFRLSFVGGVPELADGPDLESGAERRRGSSPRFPTALLKVLSQGVASSLILASPAFEYCAISISSPHKKQEIANIHNMANTNAIITPASGLALLCVADL